MRRTPTILTALAVGLTAGLVGSVGSAAPATSCAGRPATIIGTGGDDVLVGTAGPDVVAGLGGDDRILGGGGDDVVCGGAGTDDLLGGDGDDRLYGERNGLRPSVDGPDDNVGDRLAGGPGDDLLDPGHDTQTDDGGGFLPDTIGY